MEIKELCLEYGIKFSFKKMKEKYGWSFKINNEFSFGGLCSLVERKCYQDFEMTSEYAHGDSLFQKSRPLFFSDAFICMITIFFVYLQYFAELYCNDLLSYDYYVCKEKIYKYLEDYCSEE